MCLFCHRSIWKLPASVTDICICWSCVSVERKCLKFHTPSKAVLIWCAHWYMTVRDSNSFCSESCMSAWSSYQPSEFSSYMLVLSFRSQKWCKQCFHFSRFVLWWVFLVYECVVSWFQFSIKCKDKTVLLLFRLIWIAFILPKWTESRFTTSCLDCKYLINVIIHITLSHHKWIKSGYFFFFLFYTLCKEFCHAGKIPFKLTIKIKQKLASY